MERINATTGSYNFIDLFAGAGGLSEGFIQAGFSPVAHVEMNPYAAQTLETRTGYYYLKAQGKLDIYKDYISGKITRDEFLQHIPEEQLQSVFCETMSNETLPRLFENIDRILTQRGIKQVDVIIGGPPCQAYSLVGRAQSKHMETPMSADPRNDLYKLYARFLQKYHPKMFVFENVMGIKSANSGATWLKVQEALRSVGYEIECHEQNSKNFGVLQNRRRMIIVGWLKNTGLSYPQFEQTIADANRTEELPTSTLRSIKPFLPPELIIQDELHLITGPLGTVYGAYETVIEDLCSYTIGEKKIKPKYVVSTATIKNAAEQTKCLYGRKVTAQFPPNGFEIGDSFYIREVPVEQDPFRRCPDCIEGPPG